MASYITTDERKVTTRRFLEMKQSGEKISMLTSYDYTTAAIVDAAGIDSILIGDSASNVMVGNKTTLPMTVDQMIYHTRAVVNAVKRALVVCDMPFGSYQTGPRDAVANAVRIMKEGGCDGLKIEGGVEILESVKRIIDAGIPVMAHLGLTPQSIHKFGSYAVRAKDDAEAEKLLSDAHEMDKAGCFGITLEKIPAKLASEVTRNVKCATIGIGAGNGCDGQVLVYADMMGLSRQKLPKFVRHYADLGTIMADAVSRYVADVKSGNFPNEQESY